MLSVILPSYNEEKMIAKATERMAEILQPEKIDYELLFIDDGSRDNTWAQINEAAGKDSHVVGVHFSRNFGKEAAMFAGLEQAKGDCCVVIDCDLQHPPEKIVEMYRLWEQGYEVVEGIKEDRGEESGLHKFAANSFYGLISKATGMDMSSSSDFKLLDRKVVDTLNSLPERNVFFRALSFWVGYKKTSVSYCVQERTEGVSKWSTKSLIKYALTNISSFSSAPLHIVTVLGFIMLAVSVVLGIIALVQKISGVALGGFTTVILLLLFSASIIMISLGIIGYYIARIYDEIKGKVRLIANRESNISSAPTEIALLHAGHFIGESCLSRNIFRLSGTAVEFTELLCISKAKLNALMETDPVIGVKLLRKFIESLSDKIARTNDVLRHTADYDANTVILPSG